MKLINAVILASVFSTQVFAAQFSSIGKMSSIAAQNLAKVGSLIVKDENNFGDNGSVSTLSFTRKATETNMATVKQLGYKLGANSDDGFEDFNNAKVSDIVDYAFFAIAVQDEDQENAVNKARANLAAALTSIKGNKSLQVYGSQHADEDGSWNIVYVIDTKTNQVALLKIGYSGT